MKLSTELRNLPIVSIAEGEEVGFVKDFIVDPDNKAIVAIVIEDSQWFDGNKVISFSLIHSIGDFAITTENSSSVVKLASMPELTDLLKKGLKIIGARVITRGGRFVGSVREFSIDASTGAIIGLELTGDSDISAPDKNVIPSSAIVTLGRDVIIVLEDVQTMLTGSHIEAQGNTSAPRVPSYSPPKAAPAPAAPVYTPAPAPTPAPVAEPEPVYIPEPTIEEPIIEDTYTEPAASEDYSGIIAEEAPASVDDLDSFDLPADIDIEVEADETSAAADGGIFDSDTDIESLIDLNDVPTADSVADSIEVDGVSFETSEAADEEVSGESLSDIFERRQIKYMIGKKVSRDIETDDGITIAKKSEAITMDIITAAKDSGKFLELSMNIEIEE